MTAPALIDAAGVLRLIGWRGAVSAVRDALGGGLDPAAQPPRTFVPTAAGKLILMPAAHGDAVGVKVLSVAPGNAARGAPRIQATYTLMDAATLTPRAVIDGAALTTLRTPALSAAVADRLAPPDAGRLVVFGAGPQAEGHVHAMRAVRDLRDVVVVARRAAAAEALRARLAAAGVAARISDADAVAGADIVATCTSARDPLFDGGLVRDGACVVAVGSHDPAARELDDRDLPPGRIDPSRVVVVPVGGELEHGLIMAQDERIGENRTEQPRRRARRPLTRNHCSEGCGRGQLPCSPRTRAEVRSASQHQRRCSTACCGDATC
ncbi:ornithine cyclodeaminase family protein [Microbacterium petrolearium]